MILNVNVPDVPYEHLRGSRARGSAIGTARKPSCVQPIRVAARCTGFGPAGEGADAGEGTDFHAVANGCVSVTPLQVDLTRHSALAAVDEWLRGRETLSGRGLPLTGTAQVRHRHDVWRLARAIG